ncbi:MAG: shikimate dehydrogenase [Saprospiraceae bacterium]|nr:shikimate dehydrogenase [Saprospiraceae bacterium]
MRLYGLIGYPLVHSFSKKYFDEKFAKENIKDCDYRLFPISSINDLPDLIKSEPNLLGINITIPYKTKVLEFVDTTDKIVKSVGAANTVRIKREANKILLEAFNTDVYGFENSIKPLLKEHHKKALILGSGGASKAVKYVLKALKIEFNVVSRNPSSSQILYTDLNKNIIEDYNIIINSTPIGTFPKTEELADIPYQFITKKHLLFDLVYNPAETEFLRKGKEQGAIIKNGLEMLGLQAKESWRIWIK